MITSFDVWKYVRGVVARVYGEEGTYDFATGRQGRDFAFVNGARIGDTKGKSRFRSDVTIQIDIFASSFEKRKVLQEQLETIRDILRYNKKIEKQTIRYIESDLFITEDVTTEFPMLHGVLDISLDYY